jgi:ribonuclease HI
MSVKNKPKFYVVWEGRKPGIYTTWAETLEQVGGYPEAKYKSFSSRTDAETAFRGNYWSYAGRDTTTIKKSRDELKTMGVDLDGIAVDAACNGSPGDMEYRGVDLRTGTELFHGGPYADGTNNVGEFLAIVHALGLLQKRGQPDVPIYSDSLNAQSWVRRKQCRTKLQRTGRNERIFELIDRAIKWLHENSITNPILKWETEKWGEIPADYGRK